MELYIFNKDYEKVGFIDQAESVLWNKKYNDLGECEIYVPCNNENIEVLQRGYYVYRSNDDMFCKIETIQIETDIEDGDYIIATAIDICKILSGRIIRWEITYSGTVYNFIKKLINDNIVNPAQTQRRIDKFVFIDDGSNLTDTIEMNVFTADLLETIKTVCKTYNYGFKLTYNFETDQLEFRVYKGSNKANISSNEYVEFSPTYSNILSSNYKEDESKYKNVCYVGYKDSNDKTQLLSVFNTSTEPTGEDRKEIYVDGSSVNRDITEDELRILFGTITLTNNIYYDSSQTAVAIVDGDKITITDYTYLILIKILGLNTLAEHNKTQEFTGEVDTINTYEYKKDYNLGDIVKVINDYGIEAEARITEIMESDDSEDGLVIEPIFEYIN